MSVLFSTCSGNCQYHPYAGELLLEAAQTLGANRRQLLARVILPGILPNLYNDLRDSPRMGLDWLVIAELIGEKTGLTGFIDTQGTRYNFDRVFPVIILIGLTGFFTDRLLHWLRHLFPMDGRGPNPERTAYPIYTFVS